MYKLMPNNILTGNPTEVVYRIHDKTWIPFGLDNPEYQAYLKWVDGYEMVNGVWKKTSNGNTPEPAEGASA